MKLVDILARELKVWPEGIPCMWVAHGNVIIGRNNRGHEYEMNGCWAIPEDHSIAIVYPDQWQAAVDALKASGGAITAPSDEAIEAWLVGLEIPYGIEAAQACREIINNHKRKRDEAIEIQKIRDEIKWQKPQLGPCPVEQMYLLGYRKFEIVDN